MHKKLTQAIFKGKDPKIVVACVDFDGFLRFGDSVDVYHTAPPERWQGAHWIEFDSNSRYEPVTKLVRK